MVARDPGHSRRYIDRFAMMAAQGHDLLGEARLIDALVPRGAAILDAGCGPGRHAGYLHAAGHRVVGVDVDPVLIAAAQADAPGPIYLVADLAGYDLPPDAPPAFDSVLCAGNVMTFLHPATRVAALRGMADRLTFDGRVVVGFGAGRGYSFEEFEEDAATAGLKLEHRFASWDLREPTADSPFRVWIHTRCPEL